MRYFKQNYSTYIKLNNFFIKNNISYPNRCTCCLGFRKPYSIDHKYRNTKDSFIQNGAQFNHIGLLSSTSIRHFSSSEKPVPDNPQGQEKPSEKTKKKSIFKRFKEMYRDYWYVLIPVHLVTSAAWAGGFYYLATSGVDIPSLLEAINCSEKIVNSMRNSSMGYWAITYALYKMATPARYAVTLGGTTVSIQYLNKWGYIKPTAELKEMYREKKQNIIDHKENIMEKVSDFKDKKDKFVERVKETQKGIQDKKDSLFGKMTPPSEKKVEKKNDKS